MSKEVIVKLTSDRIKVKGGQYVQDLVRCKECKWFDSKGHCMRLTAEYGTYEDVGLDDFCSYGERSE